MKDEATHYMWWTALGIGVLLLFALGVTMQQYQHPDVPSRN